MLGKLSTFSPAVATLKQDFFNTDPFWISLKKDVKVFVLGRNTLSYKDKNTNAEGSIDISFVSTDYHVPFSNYARSGYIPTSLLNFGNFQPVNAFLPAIQHLTISKKEIEKGNKPFKKWWIKKQKESKESKSKESVPSTTIEQPSIENVKRKSKKKDEKKDENKSKKRVKKEGGSIKKSKKRVSAKKSYRKKSKKRISPKKKICRENKIGRVMKEFKSGKLKMKSGKIVTNRKQAIAIALSESDKYC